jgi:pimeloyl-ACP methyl ester carboxylesterase
MAVDIARSLVTSGGATVAYRVSRPTAPPRGLIVLVHGLASNLTRWTEFVRETTLRDSWALLRPDLRGFGDSVVRGRVGLDAWCRDLAAILHAEQASSAVFIGHCFGANIILQFAARYPAATRGLVLIEPMFRDALTGPLRSVLPLRPAASALASLVRGLNALGLHRRQIDTLDLEQLDGEARAAMAARGPAAFPEDRYASPLDDLRFTPTAVYLSALLAITGRLPDLRTIRAPILALLSRGGRYGDPTTTARILADHPRCQTRMLDARHWIPTERPVEMRLAIEEWCDRLCTPTP